ncbi:MAG: hypothetical protein QXM65_00060 [Candidatus Bathyarchaeia archaeon]
MGLVQRKILTIFQDGRPMSLNQVAKEANIRSSLVGDALRRLWQRGYLLRTDKPLREVNRAFKGRAGISSNMRTYYLYILRPPGKDLVQMENYHFVRYAKEHLDERGRRHGSKAKMILDFLKENKNRAWFSNEVAKALKSKGVKPSDVMTNVRRFEKKGWVYVRGYRTDYGETPFRDGYLLTWVDQNKPREQALEEAIQRTGLALKEIESVSPIVQRVRIIKDIVYESTKLRELVSFDFIKNKLNCSEYEAETAISRTIQLYPDIREVKLFNAYRYYYHNSMPADELRAAIAMKENYIRKVKGRANRIGHNWEACAEWFIDTLTTGAHFWVQRHRNNAMDPKRITIHLIKSVGGRKNNAEVDRVWDVTPAPLLQPTTYVLECKWGLIRKRDVDDFFNMLLWSKEFGVDTPEGRKIKQGVMGVFAGSAFDPSEKVQLKDGSKISLSSYAARMNIQLLKANDFNERLWKRGCSKNINVQKICKLARDEKEVRDILKSIWENPKNGEKILSQISIKNNDVYEFEKCLLQVGK